MEQEIIPAQNIAFAVLTDGTYIANFRKPNGGGGRGCNSENILKFFQGIVDYIKNCPDEELAPFALTQIIFDSQIKMTTINRMEKVKSERESQ